MAYLAKPLMKKGGPLFTMSHYGSQRVVKNYNIMGVALEAAVRYMAAEFGPKGIRVHAVSADRSRRVPHRGFRSSTRCSTRRERKRRRAA